MAYYSLYITWYTPLFSRKKNRVLVIAHMSHSFYPQVYSPQKLGHWLAAGHLPNWGQHQAMITWHTQQQTQLRKGNWNKLARRYQENAFW